MARDPRGQKLREGSAYAVDPVSGTFDSVTTDEATIDGNRIYIQSDAPLNPSEGDIWFDLP